MPLEIKTSRISGLAAVNSFDSISPTLNFSGINEFEDVNIDTFSCREDRGLSSSGKSVWISVIETGSQYVSRLKNDSLSDMGSQTYSNERLQSYLGVVEKMSKLEQLQQGWDGGKGAPINKAVLKEAVQFVLELKTEQLTFLHCVPLTYGGIQLEWDRESKSLEIEFASPTRRHYLQWDPSNEIEEEGSDERIGYSFLNTLVDWFFNG